MMSARPARTLSPATLALPVVGIVGSAVALAVGVGMTVRTTSALDAALNSTTATAADVYGGQSMIVVAAAVLGAGIVSLVVAVSALAVLVGFGGLRRPAVGGEVIEAPADDPEDDYDWGDDEDAVSEAGRTALAEDVATRELESAPDAPAEFTPAEEPVPAR